MRALSLAIALSTLPGAALARPTVAVVPLATASAEEYQWVGAALANALATRVAQQPDLNAVTIRQVSAAARQDNLEGQNFTDPAVATKLGRLLGADLLVVGSYAAAWPDIQVKLKILDVATSTLKGDFDIKGGLDKLFELEAEAAKRLAEGLGAKEPNVVVGAFGTDALRAWRDVTLAESILDWQALNPGAADPHAELALPKDSLAKARALALEATQIDQDYGEAWAALGIAQALLGETKEAWRSFGKATALGSGHYPTAVLGAAFVRMRDGRFDEAAEILRSAIGRQPGFLHARGYLGELLNHQGRYKEALAVFEEYLATAPHHPWVLAQRGYTKGKLGDHTAAIADTIAAVDVVPESPSLLIQLASRYIDAGKLVGAEDALLHALQLHPNETRVFVRLGYVYLLEGKDELAIPITEKALVQARLASTGNDRAYAHLNLARAYGHTGDLERALQQLNEAKAAGLASFGEVERDPKLEALRRDPRYRKLVP